MDEIIFEVRDAEEGGYLARALGQWEELRDMVRDAVACHFADAAARPKIIRLHFVRDEVLAA